MTATTCTEWLIKTDYAHDDDGTAVQVYDHLAPEDGETGCSHGYYLEKSQRMHKHIMALDDAYQHAPVSEPGFPTNPLASDRPRHVPDIDDGVTGPWSTWIASQQIHPDQLVSESLYEPAAEFAASGPLLSSLARGANPADALDSDGPVEMDTSSDGAMPEDNIDPPPRPDPVGPPSELVCRNTCYLGKAPRHRTGGGRRYRPLNPENRENARITRKNGPCWTCTLQRNQVRSIPKGANFNTTMLWSNTSMQCKFEHQDDEECIGCKKKVKKSLLPDCIRIRLPDLTSVFIPGKLPRLP